MIYLRKYARATSHHLIETHDNVLLVVVLAYLTTKIEGRKGKIWEGESDFEGLTEQQRVCTKAVLALNGFRRAEMHTSSLLLLAIRNLFIYL